MPNTSTATDTFATLNTTLWANNFGTTSVTGGRGRAVANSSVSAFVSSATFTLDSMYFQAFPTNTTGAGIYQYTLFGFYADENNAVRMYAEVSDTTVVLVMETVIAGATNRTTLTYNATDHAWWQIIRSGGNTLFQTSTNGSSWTTRRTVTTPSAVGSTSTGYMKIEGYRSSGSTNYDFDNLNTPGAVDLNLVAGSFPTLAITSKAGSAFDNATSVKSQPTLVIASGTVVSAADIAVSLKATPGFSAVGNVIASAADNTTAVTAQPTLAGVSYVLSGMSISDQVKSYPTLAMVAGAVVQVYDTSTAVTAQPLLTGATGVLLSAADHAVGVKAIPTSVVATGRAALGVGHGAVVTAVPILPGISNAVSTGDSSTDVKALSAILTAGKAVSTVGLGTVVKSDPTLTLGLSNIALAYDRAEDLVMAVPALALATGGTDLEAAPPDEIPLNLTAGSFPVLVAVASLQTMADHVTAVRAEPTLADVVTRIESVGDIATSVMPIPALPGITRVQSAAAHTAAVRPMIIIPGLSSVATAVDHASVVKSRPAVVMSRTQIQAVMASLVAVKSAPTLTIVPGGVVTALIYTGPILKLWDGTTEHTLILEGVWNGTEIVPAVLDVLD